MARYDDAIAQELDVLIGEATPYSLSSPSFGNPTIHDFVKGLILATNIIKVIKKYLPEGYYADWGQIIDKRSGNALSNESDIIIYKGKPGCKTIENQSMRFVLVDKDQARVVIQVKSGIDAVKEEDKKYCKSLSKFVPQVWFFTECCWANSKSRVRDMGKKLKKAGYKQFFYLYSMNDNRNCRCIDYSQFIKFIELIKKIK
jgi:hypothetical protein